MKEKVLKNGNVAFRCDFPKKACKGRVTTNPERNRVISQQAHDMHAPDQSAIIAKVSKARFKQSAIENPSTPLSALLKNEVAQVPTVAQPDIPSESALKKCGQRVRRKDFPKKPSICPGIRFRRFMAPC